MMHYKNHDDLQINSSYKKFLLYYTVKKSIEDEIRQESSIQDEIRQENSIQDEIQQECSIQDNIKQECDLDMEMNH